MESVPLKRCRKCGIEKPATKESFAYYGDKLRGRCRACKNEAERQKAAIERSSRSDNALPAGFKRCTKCHEIKLASLDNFPPNNTIKSGLNPSCRVCQTAYYKQYSRQNKQKISERRANYQKKPEVKLKRAELARRQRQIDPNVNRAACLKWRHNNLDRARASSRQSAKVRRDANPELFRERNRALYAKNPEVFRAHSIKRRALLKKVGGVITGNDLKAQLIHQSFKCFYCDCDLKKLPTPWHADHFIPLSKGGSNEPANIVIACQFCNLSKHDKFPWQWMPERFSQT